jgi:16S rRNA C1402 N4-methylase RsmH
MNSFDVVMLIGAILGSSALATLIGGLVSRKKTRVDADGVTIQNALNLQKATVERVDAYEKKLTAMESELHDFERYINYLDSLLWRAGIEHMTLEQYRRGKKDGDEDNDN